MNLPNDEWFENPLDKMPIATDGTNKYHPNGEPPSWEDTAPSEYEPPDEWFDNPLDKMPIANGSNKYAPAARLAELEAESNPRPEEEIADWFSNKVEKPDESDEIEEEKTMHQKMYEIATAKYNPFSIGGSENLGGGSEKINGTE